MPDRFLAIADPERLREGIGTAIALLLVAGGSASAGVGDPQVRTDHPWYPGELACSTLERLFATQADVYKRVTGRDATTDEDKALAAWLWRNTHYFHAEEGAEDLFGKGVAARGSDNRTREYWTGLYSHGFGLCGTTHAQWSAEMDALLGRGRGRDLGGSGHNSFEAFLKGGEYGAGKWVLLDHDTSTVVFDKAGKRLLGIKEVAADWKTLTDRGFAPDRQRGWPVCGLHSSDGKCYDQYRTAEYFPGYAGPPPVVHLRRGETLRRYLAPGLADGKTYVFWGMNYRTDGVPGPERSLTWVNQPEKMFKSKTVTPSKKGQARFANAVYVYRPDFASNDYKEGVVSEDAGQVTLSFRSPFVVAATPPNAEDWGVYAAGCKNGLVVRGAGEAKVSVSVDDGRTWVDGGKLSDTPDLTDAVKGHRQYRLRVHAGAKELAAAGLTVTTVCQANAAVMPRLVDGGSVVTFGASGRAVASAGPALPHATTHVVAGEFKSPAVTLGLATPHGEPVERVYAAAHVASGNPPRPDVKYQIELSTDGGKSWSPVVADWAIPRVGDEPDDFWSQSLVYGSAPVAAGGANVRVRFANTGRKQVLRAEAHAVYRLPTQDATKVTFAWADTTGDHTDSHTFGAAGTWTVPTGRGVTTRWVEFEAKPK